MIDGIGLLFGMISTVIIYRYAQSCRPGNILHSSRPGGRRSIPTMLECAWSCGNSKSESGYQQHSNNGSSVMYGLDLGMKSGKEFLEYISTLIEHGERYPRLKVEPTYCMYIVFCIYCKS
jgi:hypothetical protein